MAVFSSVFTEAGFATGAGRSGAFVVIGCGVSGFLSPHILTLRGHVHLRGMLVLDRGAKHFISLHKNATR
jgi:hypothetical protein